MGWAKSPTAMDQRILAQNQRLLQHLNTGQPCPAELKQLFHELFGQALTKDSQINLPFYTDYGTRIQFGSHVHIDHDVTLIAQAGITIGSDVSIGPGALLVTTEYRYRAPQQAALWQAPIVIGDHVKIGGRVVIYPGVKIGADAIIAAGEVITQDVVSGAVITNNK